MLPDLIAACPEATAWVGKQMAEDARNDAFEWIAASVVWSDVNGPDGKPLVPIDPVALATKINAEPFDLLRGHDPGFQIGKCLAAEAFVGNDNKRFVAAMLGFYGKKRLSFYDFKLDSVPVIASPSRLPELTGDCWIELCYDPKEVDEIWIANILDIAPLRVERERLSHNAAESLIELVRVGLPYIALVWNPFVTAIATEAGKDTYASLRNWVRKLLGKLAEQRNPVLEIQSYHEGCYISFIFRGVDVKRHYAAHDAHPLAAHRAAILVANMKRAGVAAKKIVYEFSEEGGVWFPSYAELYDGRFVTDNQFLIAVENVPSGLSLGISFGKEDLPPVTPINFP